MTKTTQDRIRDIEHALNCRDQGEDRDEELKEELELLTWFDDVQYIYQGAYTSELTLEDVEAWREYFDGGYSPQAAIEDRAQYE